MPDGPESLDAVRASLSDSSGERIFVSRSPSSPPSCASIRSSMVPRPSSNGCSANSQMTVRSFGSTWNDNAVIDRPQPTVLALEHVTALAIGVVDHRVERGEGREVLGPLLDEHEEVPLRVVLDEELQGARPSGASSRRTVGGTKPHPPASLTTNAATSRAASVPSGKSHSGRSPRHRFVDGESLVSPRSTSARNV